jgi:hypothetical protein
VLKEPLLPASSDSRIACIAPRIDIEGNLRISVMMEIQVRTDSFPALLNVTERGLCQSNQDKWERIA